MKNVVNIFSKKNNNDDKKIKKNVQEQVCTLNRKYKYGIIYSVVSQVLCTIISKQESALRDNYIFFFRFLITYIISPYDHNTIIAFPYLDYCTLYTSAHMHTCMKKLNIRQYYTQGVVFSSYCPNRVPYLNKQDRRGRASVFLFTEGEKSRPRTRTRGSVVTVSIFLPSAHFTTTMAGYIRVYAIFFFFYTV